MSQVIIDVREPDEFDAEHIENSVHIPLSSFGTKAPAILKCLAGQEVVLMCLGGKRAAMAEGQIPAFALTAGPTISVYQGGLQAWKAAGKPTVAGASHGSISIFRQVQICAGLLVFGAVVASQTFDSRFIYLAGFVGAGLTFAGVSGICMMGDLLAKLPWNKT